MLKHRNSQTGNTPGWEHWAPGYPSAGNGTDGTTHNCAALRVGTLPAPPPTNGFWVDVKCDDPDEQVWDHCGYKPKRQDFRNFDPLPFSPPHQPNSSSSW